MVQEKTLNHVCRFPVLVYMIHDSGTFKGLRRHTSATPFFQAHLKMQGEVSNMKLTKRKGTKKLCAPTR